jgi:putative endonuclease
MDSMTERMDLGMRGEDLACETLVKAGYQIIGRNVRCRRGEIDVIAWDQGTLCFVEVRTRQTTANGHPLETVNSTKQGKLVSSAQAYMDQWEGPWPELRFDVIGVVMDEGPSQTLVKEAFEA